MIDEITKLDIHELLEISAAIRSGRIKPPYMAFAMQRFLAPASAHYAANGLNQLIATGVSHDALSNVLDLLVVDRRRHVSADNVIDLVTSGPDTPASANRDTAVVVRDMFAYAKRSVWLAGYAVHKGQRVFEALADRMVAQPDLQVVLILDVRRGPGDTTANDDLLRRFTSHFREREWPQNRPLPKVFYFPKSLESDPRDRAALHAKCVVIDAEACFVSSANFTQAAQSKNVEIGLLVRSDVVAKRLQRYLEGLVQANIVQPVA
jgi:phosphatidylserine/phosphatidylglycerophosphate/cardiolipin synthase-like enzyme